jgi:hypothetical protein
LIAASNKKHSALLGYEVSAPSHRPQKTNAMHNFACVSSSSEEENHEMDSDSDSGDQSKKLPKNPPSSKTLKPLQEKFAETGGGL